LRRRGVHPGDAGVPVRRVSLAIALGAVMASLSAMSTSTVSLAEAQDESDGALAREAFQQGMAATRESRWEAAAEHFQRSFELSPRPMAMMNLAGALAQLGRLVEAAEAYRSFLSLARTGTALRLRQEAEQQLRALEQRIPRVRLRVLGLTEGDVVRLDEYEVSPSALELPLPVDPGRHSVLIARGGRERSMPFAVSEGVATEVVLDARPETFAGEGPLGVEVAEGALEPERPAEGRSIVEEPAFWIVIGAVVLTGVAVGVGVGVATQGGGAPFEGNLGPGVRL
jgi:hypothetical protein